MPVWKKNAIAVLSAVFLICAVLYYLTLRDYKKADEIYAASREAFTLSDTTATQTEPEYFPDELSVDFAELQAANPDVVAWIYMPDTVISYPVVQGENNQRYTAVSYNGQYSNSGSIFVDYRCTADFEGRNTIIYGHNMKSGKMFGGLKKLTDADYLAEHRFFYIITPEKLLKYQIFSVHKTDKESWAYSYELSNLDMKQYIADALAESEIDCGAEPTKEDKLVLLSTCTSTVWNERLVVHGLLIANK